MNIRVKKLTGVELLRKANSSTTGHESRMSLATAYRCGYSPIRTQIWWIELREIPLFVASQLVRQHVGVQFYQKSHRPDRNKNAKDEGRMTPTDLACIINAEALMNMAHKRLCGMASKETREVMKSICELVEEQDPDLFRHLVPQCVYRGGICPELKCCGYIHSQSGQKALENYRQPDNYSPTKNNNNEHNRD